MKKRLFTLILLLCAFTLNAVSQKTAIIKSFAETTDHISGSDRRKDKNGILCSLVKVQVVDDISRVEGNKIGNIVNKGVEKWVYMCKGSRNMRIHLKNHLPVKVMFQDYNINGLESNRVYELVIETSSAPVPPDKMQKLIINYTPVNAMVLIDSKPYKGNGRIETELPIGEHRYLIAADRYITVEGMVKINEQGTRVITENLVAEDNTGYSTHNNTGESSYDGQRNNELTTTLYENRYPTNYTKSMLKGEGAFLYKGIYYIVISQERKTVAVVKPQKVKYEDNSYTIPAQVSKGNDLYTVTEIAPSTFERSKNLSNIILPETIEAIGAKAFYLCNKLDHFTFPSNLRYVGSQAFYEDNISELLLPNSIEEIADDAFLMCKKGNDLHKNMGKLYVPNTVKKIGKNAFAGFRDSIKKWTAKFDIQNLPEWITPTIAKEIGIHEDSYIEYVRKGIK